MLTTSPWTASLHVTLSYVQYNNNTLFMK